MLFPVLICSILYRSAAGNLRAGRGPSLFSVPFHPLRSVEAEPARLLFIEHPSRMDNCTHLGVLPSQRADLLTQAPSRESCFASCRGSDACKIAAYLQTSQTCLGYYTVYTPLIRNADAVLAPNDCNYQWGNDAFAEMSAPPPYRRSLGEGVSSFSGLLPTIAQITACMLDPVCLESIGDDFSALLPSHWQQAFSLMTDKLFDLSNREGGLFSGNGLGLIKQSVGPDDEFGEPEVTCYREGMVCCVPKETVTKFEEYPPRLNGLDDTECVSRWNTLNNQYCAASVYDSADGNTCGLTVMDTEELTLYRHVLFMNEKYLNNAICTCAISKTDDNIVPHTAWEYVVQAQAAAAEEVDSDDPGEPVGSTALAQTQIVGYTKSAEVNGGGELVPVVEPYANAQWLEFVSEVPSLSTAPLSDARRLTGDEVCVTPWPRSCKVWRPSCETNPVLAATAACTPTEFIREGCPVQPFDVEITHTAMGKVAFRVQQFSFADSRSSLLGCSFDLVSCEDASFEGQCGGISVGGGRRLLAMDWKKGLRVGPTIGKPKGRRLQLLGRRKAGSQFSLVTVAGGVEVLLQRVEEENILGKSVAFDVGKTASTYSKFTDLILGDELPKEDDPKSAVRRVTVNGLNYVFKTEILKMGTDGGLVIA